MWVTGQLTHNIGKNLCNGKGLVAIDFYEVDENTVGAFTGMIDSQGHEIYEGDILYIDEEMPHVVVKYNSNSYGFAVYWQGSGGVHDICSEPLHCFDNNSVRIIGNIYTHLDWKSNIDSLDPDFSQFVDEHFWELI